MRNHLWVVVALHVAFGCKIVFAQDWIPERVVGMNYPPLAAHARRQGTVTLQCRIGEDGLVKSVKTISDSEQLSGNLLSQAAEDNATKWKFGRPKAIASVSGTSGIVVLKYTFVLEGDSRACPKALFVFEYPDSVTVTAEPPSVQP